MRASQSRLINSFATLEHKAPVGVFGWCILQIAVFSSLRGRGAYVEYLEDRLRFALTMDRHEFGDDLMLAESRMAGFFARRTRNTRSNNLLPTFWTALFLLFGIVVLTVFVGLVVEAFTRAESYVVRWMVLISSGAGVILILVLALWALVSHDRWEAVLGLDKRGSLTRNNADTFVVRAENPTHVERRG